MTTFKKHKIKKIIVLTVFIIITNTFSFLTGKYYTLKHLILNQIKNKVIITENNNKKDSNANNSNSNDLNDKTDYSLLDEKSFFDRNIFSSSNTDISQLIKTLSDKNILDILEHYAGIKKNMIPNDLSVQDFANNLIDIALDDYTTDEEEHNPTNIVFCSSLNIDGHPYGITDTFSTNDLRIYACFKTKDIQANSNQLFAKWINKNNMEIEIFEPVNYRNDLEWNYLWLKQNNQWVEGEYSVKLYSLDKNMDYLASGIFKIESPINEMISSIEFKTYAEEQSQYNNIFYKQNTSNIKGYFNYKINTTKTAYYETYNNNIRVYSDWLELNPNNNKIVFQVFSEKEIMKGGKYNVYLYLNNDIAEIGQFILK